MWESLAETIKIFFEKHLIPTILSLVLGTIVLLCTPKDNWILVELSKTGYWLFASGCVFIVIQFLIWVCGKLKSWQYSLDEEKRNKEYQIWKNRENLGKWWDYVDSLDKEDRDYLKRFLENKNQPIIVRGIIFYNHDVKLFGSRYVKKQQCYDEQGPYTKYILDEAFYNMLVYSAENYGKISRFDEV